MGLGTRVALVVALVGAAATATVGFVAFHATEDRLIEELDGSLQRTASVLLTLPDRRPAMDAGPRGGRGGPRVVVPERLVGIDQFVVQVLDTSGTAVRASAGVVLPVTARDAVVAGNEAGSVLASGDDPDDGTAYRVLTAGVPGGAVQVGRSLAETEAVLDDLRSRLVAVVVGVTVAGAALGWLVAWGVTGRIRRLTATADAVGTSGDPDVTVSVTGNDEAGRLGRAMNRMLGSLAESRRQQQRLVEDAGHELRTPLTSLRTNVDVLRRHRDLPDDVRDQVLADLDRDVVELASLVNEVVAVAADRHDDGDKVATDLGGLVAAVAQRVQRRTGRTIAVTADDSVVTVRPAAMERAVSNLLDNATKFDRSPAPVDVTVADGCITVADRGPGIPDADLAAVFERFHRSAEARALPGSGLGLSIVAAVAADHAGTVFARNRPGGGAEVGLCVPRSVHT
jgi:two-component system sensor histidine kinase MprB